MTMPKHRTWTVGDGFDETVFTVFGTLDERELRRLKILRGKMGAMVHREIKHRSREAQIRRMSTAVNWPALALVALATIDSPAIDHAGNEIPSLAQ